MTSDEVRQICAEHAITVSLAGFVRESDVARLLDVDIRTLQNWRRDLRGPACVRMGRTWRYALDALAHFMTPANESGKGRKEREIPVSDGQSPSRDHSAFQTRKVES